jgi:hypothetical protein
VSEENSQHGALPKGTSRESLFPILSLSPFRSKKTQPAYNLVFLLSGGGKINFLGSKKWIDDLNEDGEGGRQQEEDLSSFEIMKHQVRQI